MKYEIKESYIINAGDISELAYYVYNTNNDAHLPKGTIVKVILAQSDKITLQVLRARVSTSCKFGDIWIFDRSPAENFYFDKLIKSLDKLSTSDLIDEDISQTVWSEKYLHNYISFLEDQIEDNL